MVWARWNFLIFLLFPLSPFLGFSYELPYDEIEFQGHRCLVVIPPDLPDNAPVILALHGSLGNGEESFGCFYQNVDLPPCIWLFPDGPIVVRQRSRRTVIARHAWYDRFTHSYSDMKKSREWLSALLERYSRKGLGEDGEEKLLAKPRPVVILGQSQGGVMAFETGMNYPGNVLAIISVCGFIEYPEKTLLHPQAAKNTAILMLNGKLDPVVQDEDARATAQELRKKGYRPSLRFYGVGHLFTAGMKGEVWNFLRGMLNGQPKMVPQDSES